MIVEIAEHIEYHPNGQVWITGQIGIIAPLFKDSYDYRGEAQPWCRLGIWTKHYDNGQLAWTIDYGDGTWPPKPNQTGSFPQFRKDGTGIQM